MSPTGYVELFCIFYFAKKIQAKTACTEKLQTTLLNEKAASKMLMKQQVGYMEATRHFKSEGEIKCERTMTSDEKAKAK